MSRTYFDHRRARAPRIWVGGLIAGVINVAWMVPFAPRSLYLLIPVGLAVGWLVAKAQWWLWKHQHPDVTITERAARARARQVEQEIRDLRDKAMWN